MHPIRTGAAAPLGVSSLAVSVLVIKSLAALQAPVVPPAVSQQLLGVALSKDSQAVKLTCITQILGTFQGPKHGAKGPRLERCDVQGMRLGCRILAKHHCCRH